MLIAPGLLDRLIDAPAPSRRASSPGAISLAEYKRAVALDLEALLNTRRSMTAEEVLRFPLGASSVFNFGVEDFSSASLASTTDRAAVCASIEHTIKAQDKRLFDLVVSLTGSVRDANRLTFTIYARLRSTAYTEAVVFDARFEPMVQRYTVALGAGARAAP